MWSVESGKRPLRLAEAADLATILGVPLETLTTSLSPADAHARAATSALRSRWTELIDALEGVRRAHERVNYLAELDTISPRYRESLIDARAMFSVETALNEGRPDADLGEHVATYEVLPLEPDPSAPREPSAEERTRRGERKEA